MKKIKIITAVAAAALIASCAGDDGRNGANGANGANGLDGKDGVSELVLRASKIHTANGSSFVTETQSFTGVLEVPATLSMIEGCSAFDTANGAATLALGDVVCKYSFDGAGIPGNVLNKPCSNSQSNANTASRSQTLELVSCDDGVGAGDLLSVSGDVTLELKKADSGILSNTVEARIQEVN